MLKFLLFTITSLALIGCGSTNQVATEDVATNKQKISNCMRENYKDKENCVDQRSIASVGLICKNVTVTGSRLPLRKCTTAAQREQRRENARLSVDDIQRGLQTTTTAETRMHNGY